MEDTLRRLEDLERRLRALEERIGSQPPDTAPLWHPVAQAHAQPELRTQDWVEPRKSPRAEVTTSQFLGIIGIICFIFASVLLIKLSIDSGWLTPVRQVGLAALFGFLLIGVGLVPSLADRRYASLLPGAGVVVLNLAVHGGHFIHELYGPVESLLMVSAVSVVSLRLFHRWRTDFYVVAATVGTYLGALALGSRFDDMQTISGFLLVWDITFSILSVSMRSRSMVLVASYLALGSVALRGLTVSGDSSALALLAGMQALQFIIFCVSTVLYTLRNREPLTSTEMWSFFPLLLFFYGTEYWFIDRLAPDAAPWLGLGFAALVLALYRVAARRLGTRLESGQAIYLFASLVYVHAFYSQLLPEVAKPLFGVAVLVALAMAARNLELTGRHVGLSVGAAIMIGSGFLLALFGSSPHPAGWIVFNGMAYGTVILAVFFLSRGTLSTSRVEGAYFMLGAAHLQVLVALARFERIWALPSLPSLFTSLTWTAYAGGIFLYGLRKQDAVLARSSLMVLMLCAVKVFIYDVLQASAVARVISLLILGGALYGVGFLYQRLQTRARGAQ